MRSISDLTRVAVELAAAARSAAGEGSCFDPTASAALAAAQTTATATILAALIHRDLAESLLTHLETHHARPQDL